MKENIPHDSCKMSTLGVCFAVVFFFFSKNQVFFPPNSRTFFKALSRVEEGDNTIRFWEWKVKEIDHLYFYIPGAQPLVIPL